MKSYILALVLLFSTWMYAQEPPTKPYSITAGYTTNYVQRFTTQSLNKSATFVTGEYDYKGFYVSGYLANMDFGDGTTIELDGFAGYRFAVKDWNFDLEFLYIGYPNDPTTNWDMTEYDITISHNLTKKLLFAWTIGYSPDYFNVSGPGLWNQVVLTYNITDKLSVSGAVGQEWIMKQPETYEGFNIGATYQLTKNVSLDARYANTDRHDLPLFYRPTFALTLKVTY